MVKIQFLNGCVEFELLSVKMETPTIEQLGHNRYKKE
jgi:hypothetical protein